MATIDWQNLGFGYRQTEYRFVARFENGQWTDGELIEDNQITMHEGSPILHYAQGCFEGLKAQRSPDGTILLFRPQENATRMMSSATRLLMPEVPTDLFMKGLEEVVRANEKWVPPHGSGASLYIRPMLIGMGENIGIKPAPIYEFRIFVLPVGPYFSGDGMPSIKLAVTDYDRVPKNGIGHIKAVGNYAGGMIVTKEAREKGADEALYLDPIAHKYIEETNSSNVLFVTKEGSIVFPDSSCVLPSITADSLLYLAEKVLKKTVNKRQVSYEELSDFSEMGACGTAVTLAQVEKVLVNKEWISFNQDPNTAIIPQLYTHLMAIQQGVSEDMFGWTKRVPI